MEQVNTPPDTLMVVFGANGDLAKRKLLPALYNLDEGGLLPSEWRFVGTARSEVSDEQFRAAAREAIVEHERCTFDEERFARFQERLTFTSTDFRPGETEALSDAIAKVSRDFNAEPQVLFYLSTPPGTFGPITAGLGEAGLATGARVVYEKPFGNDPASFAELDGIVREVLHEDQAYRIDHFLGKESVQNLLAFRFANSAFEAMWNRAHIDHVQIDVPEDLGIDNRVAFYDQTGAIRDMLVTHLFQVLSVVAMEPPVRLRSGPLTTEKFKVFDSMRQLSPDDVVVGQFAGYRDLEGVREGSDTDTFVAARVHIDNWRWHGVPFYLRTGKAMADKRQLVTLAFRRPPATMFTDVPDSGLERDHLTFDLASGAAGFGFLAKQPGPAIRLGRANMRFTYEQSGSELIGPYERLIHDALLGDRTLFTRTDGIARTWELVEPILDLAEPHLYEPGSWGPEAATDLIAPRLWYLPQDGERFALPAI
ncbi:MAG TPA: glucose-6-phosphate dehydrogenase [Euzebyales bacterium]|nr:glucose-6-phosphate dehydrogenase [Euzebyales bacterium]